MLGKLVTGLLVLNLVSSPQAWVAGCSDGDGDGFFAEAGCGTTVDCNDADNAVHPSSAETCDGYDNDCNGTIDDDDACKRTCGPPHTDVEDGVVGSGGLPLTASFAWSGSVFGVAWSVQHESEERLLFGRLTATGKPLGDAVTLRVHGGVVRGPSLVWTGSEWAMAWHDDTAGNTEIYFARFDSQGHPVGAAQRVTDDAAPSRWPSLVWTGAEYGVAWFDGRSGSSEIFLARIDRQGVRLGVDHPITTNSDASYPHLVWSGATFGVAWTAAPAGVPLKRFVRVDPSGTPVGDATEVAPGQVETLLWTGTSYAVSGPDAADGDRGIVLSLLDDAGQKIGIDHWLAQSTLDGPLSSLAWTGSEFALSWADLGGTVRFARAIEFGFPIGENFVVGQNAGPSRGPSLLWTGTGYGVGWLGGSSVVFDRVGCNCADEDGDGVDSCADCDDTDPQTFPLAPELPCDEIDNDCDPSTPDVFDADGDGFDCDVECDDAVEAVFPGAPQICDGDCDDTNPATHPGAPEISCDGIDNDCDPETPDVFDADGDSFDCDVECDDTNPELFPGGVEIVCDGLDNDCDPFTTDLADQDQDGYECPVDCDDEDHDINPDSEEICDGVDNNCDGLSDSRLFQPRRINGFFRQPREPSAIWTGTGFGVSWVHSSHLTSTGEVYLGRYDASGNEVGSPIRLAAPSSAGGNPALAWSGTAWAVAYQDLGKLYLSRVDDTGLIGAPVVVANNPGDDPRHPALAWTGSEYGMTWIEGSGLDSVIRFARVSPTGVVSGRRLVAAGVVPSNRRRFSMAWTGAEYGLVWRRVTGFWFARLDVAGARQGDETLLATGANVFQSAVVWTGSRYAVAWEGYLALLDTSGVMLGPAIRVADEPGFSSLPSMVWTGNEFGVAFQDSRSGTSQVYLARLDEDGNKIDSDEQLSRDPVLDAEESAVFWTGVDYGAVWKHRSTLYHGTGGCSCFDFDGDGYGSCLDCHELSTAIHPDALEICNGIDDDCDTLVDEDDLGEDTDHDGAANLCDNCSQVVNPSQGDRDGDLEGDACDLDDGAIHLRFANPDVVDWDDEVGFEAWNLYRGNLAVLSGSGRYTQEPGSGALVSRECDLGESASVQQVTPASGEIAFFIATGTRAGVESDLGNDSSGAARPNANPCP